MSKEPANVRNFFIELQVDGRKTIIKTGPIAKDGGFNLTIKIRQDGAISKNELHIEGIVYASGELIIEASTKQKDAIGTVSLGTLLTGWR